MAAAAGERRKSVAICGCVLVLATAAVSCSLLVGTSDLSGATVSVDAAPDAPPGSDASNEAAPPQDPCAAPSVVLCERFDAPDSVARYPSDTDPSTSVGVDDAVFFSQPRSAKFTILPDSNMSPDATIRLETTTSLARFAFDARIHIEHGEPQEAARLLRLDTGGQELILEHSGKVKEGTTLMATVGAVPFGQWLRLRVEVRTDVSPPAAVVQIGDARSDSIPLATSWSAGRVTIVLGVSEANSPTRGWIVRWDDVVVERL